MIHDTTPATVGTIELSTLAEEYLAEMSPGNLDLGKRIGFCKVEVYPNEGEIPHFHITTKNNVKWECCIEIYKPMYFSHGSKIGTLNSKQLKLLDRWLRLPNKLFDKNTNWEVISAFWISQENPLTNVPRRIEKQPDYTKTI